MNRTAAYHETDFIEKKADNAFSLKGDWTIFKAAEIERALSTLPRQEPDAATFVDAEQLGRLDTAGGWLIKKYLRDAAISGLSERHKAVLDFVPEDMPELPRQKKHPVRNFFFIAGKSAVTAADFLVAVFSFAGLTFTRFFSNLLRLRRFRLPALVRHIHETGFRALPIISLLACGISMVIFYQGATQLQRFGADIFTVDLTVISLLREMAVLTTAIMVAGRSGSAFAAEIGVMKLRGEVDALRTIGLDPIETLVLPRLLALLITLPLLAFIADLVGLAGGGLMALLQLDLPLTNYIDRVREIATPTMFFIGLIKAPVFALLIAIVCTYQGMSVSGSAENVGKLTTLAVVQSIFLVIMADAAFSVVFSRVGI
jgi:phospholipid/cholesterol/gamma-HCH transport system permease protein